ncbi:MAG: lipopolysaccharide export system ATP-binding protein, partial [Paracoccaceae bacterium]
MTDAPIIGPNGNPLDGGLVVRGIGKTFRRRPVVRDVSIHLRRGEA